MTSRYDCLFSLTQLSEHFGTRRLDDVYNDALDKASTLKINNCYQQTADNLLLLINSHSLF